MTQQSGQKTSTKRPTDSPTVKDDYHNLNPNRVLATIQQLEKRIEERFPHAGLARVCGELLKISRDATETTLAIARPMWVLRVFIYLVITATFIISLLVVWESQWNTGKMTIADVITISEALFNDLILLGAAILFLFTIEVRVKRRRALTAIHRLRSIAHIIDMHQLTKDPEKFVTPAQFQGTASSPERKYTKFELGRYLDYCSEMLSLIGKVGAMYIEHFPDGQSVSSVNELESLTTDLSRKIWQKIMILNSDVTEI